MELETDYNNDKDRPFEHCLGISLDAYLGCWYTDKITGLRYLPIFMVSRYRVDFLPHDRKIRVSIQLYDVERHLSIRWCSAARDLMKEFAPEFSVLADTQFATYVRGAGRISLYELLQTYSDMQTQEFYKAP